MRRRTTLGMTGDEHVERAREYMARAFHHLDYHLGKIGNKPRDCDLLLRRYEAGLVAVQRAMGEVEAAKIEPASFVVNVVGTPMSFARATRLLRSARDKLRSGCFRPLVSIDEYTPHLDREASAVREARRERLDREEWERWYPKSRRR